MNYGHKIAEISANRLVLQSIVGGRLVTLHFTPLSHWRAGDPVAVVLHRFPYEAYFRDGGFVMEEVPEPPNGRGKEYHYLMNQRTQDHSTVDYESVDGYEELAAEARQAAGSGPE